jgi:hypothetical protein
MSDVYLEGTLFDLGYPIPSLALPSTPPRIGAKQSWSIRGNSQRRVYFRMHRCRIQLAFPSYTTFQGIFNPTVHLSS